MLILVTYLQLCIISSVISWNRYTSQTSYGDGDVLTLTQHRVYCNSGEVLTGFNIAQSGKNIYFQYNCQSSSSVINSQAYTKTTSWVSSADLYVIKSYTAHRISDIPIKCNNDCALQGFQLKSKSTSILDTYDIQFEYTCVPVKAKKNWSTNTARINGEFGGVEKLSPLSIDLPSYQALLGWKLNTEINWSWSDFYYVKYFRYDYDIVELRNMEQEILTYESDISKPTI
jgi:hypothetical protein